MADEKGVLDSILSRKLFDITTEQESDFDLFLKSEDNHLITVQLEHNVTQLKDNWLKHKITRKVMEQPLRIPNGTVGKLYDVPFGFDHPLLSDVDEFEWRGLELVGLQYSEELKKITGTPIQSGDIKLTFCFKIKGQTDGSAFLEKEVILTINPDAKSLWKTLDSDKEDAHWKEDDQTIFAPLGTRHILASSKRGRSHANVGSFREDDFAFKSYENGWNLVVVADGAGSAKVSRKGSALACQTLVEFFADKTSQEALSPFDEVIKQIPQPGSDDTQKQLNTLIYNLLGKAALTVHMALDTFAATEHLTLKDLSTTLIFVLFKKYETGYAIMSFGVGDCPIGILSKDMNEVTLMNWIDVGEYGGGTRFITMPEIFKNSNFSTRFGFKLMEDFSYLILMSDGIYDPKFVFEAALEDVGKWKSFIEDLQGNNADKVKVELRADNKNIEEQLSEWMNFWSIGNHDDRTLAIIF